MAEIKEIYDKSDTYMFDLPNIDSTLQGSDDIEQMLYDIIKNLKSDDKRFLKFTGCIIYSDKDLLD